MFNSINTHMNFETITDVSASSGDPVQIGLSGRSGQTLLCANVVRSDKVRRRTQMLESKVELVSRLCAAAAV